MSSVWLIESGDYSAYTVHAACATEEEAVRVAAKMNRMGAGAYGDVTYSERLIVTEDDVLPVFSAQFMYPWKEGTGYQYDAEPTGTTTPLPGSFILRPEDPSEPDVWYQRHDENGRRVGAHMARVRASDPDVALKIARDALAKARAEELGL